MKAWRRACFAAPRHLAVGTVVLAAALLISLLLTHKSADAHALLLRSDPPINATLRESPRVINLFMSEPLSQNFSSVEVVDSQGQRAQQGRVTFNPDAPTNMSIPVGVLAPGIYTVVYKTLSAVDGHTWHGSYTFTVLNPDGSAPAGSAFQPQVNRPGPPTAADAAVKWVTLIAVIAWVGSVLFALAAALPAARAAGSTTDHVTQIVRRWTWDVATAAVVLLLLTSAYDAASAAAKLGGLTFLDEVLFDTRNGLWLVLRWSLLLAATGVLGASYVRSAARRSPASLYALLVLGVGVIASLSSVSHAAAQDRGAIWATLFDAVHLMAVTVWIGMLGSLIRVLWSTRAVGPPGERRAFQIEAVRHFSLVAAGTVPVMIIAGFFSLLASVPAWRGFVDTDWGIAMLVKLGLLTVVFAAAGANAIWLRPRWSAAPSTRAAFVRLERRFRWMMRAELLVALAVIAATATLTQLPSPRSALPELTAGPQKDRTTEQMVALDNLLATLTISPNLVGQNRYEVTLREATGGPVQDRVRAVLLRFRYADPAVGPLTVATTPEGEGRYGIEGSYFGLAGEWTIELEVRRENRDDVVESVSTKVEQPFLNTLPFATSSPGALALPITQFDWNGVGAIWAAVAAGMLIAYRRPIGRRFSAKAADATVVGGVLFMAVTMVLAFSVHVDPGRTLENPVPRTPESIVRGEALFSANCIQCHGDTGGGDGPLAASLPAPPANFRVHVPYHSDGVLFTWVSNGIRGTGMPAFRTTLSEEQRWDLANFLRATFDEPLSAGDATDPSATPAP